MALTENQKTKLMVIENFINWHWSDDQERAKAKEQALKYVSEDHVDEVGGLTEEQKDAISHAYIDLLGCLIEKYSVPVKMSIEKLEKAFPFLR